MAVFVSASDEHSGPDGRGLFVFAGYVGPEQDWWRFFLPAWQERVLDGPPTIPYLHMTEIRSRAFREKWGLSRSAADQRIDEAVAVIDTMGSFYPIGIEVDAGHIKDTFIDSKVLRQHTKQFEAKQFEAKPFEPDFLCFLTYAYVVLNYVHNVHPHVEKVNFIVERKGHVTRYIDEFHSGLGEALIFIGRTDLTPLVGELSTGDKERIPCQVADMLCWHAARFENAQEVKTEDIADARRYLKLRNRKGKLFSLSNSQVSEMAGAIFPKALSRLPGPGKSG